MASPAAIRTGLETRLGTIAGLKVYRRWPSQITEFPCAIVTRTRSDPEQALGRGDLTRWELEVHLLAKMAPGYETAQDTLDPLIATSSTGGVFGAIAADRTLGGVVHTTFVRGFREDDQDELALQLSALTVVAELECWTT